MGVARLSCYVTVSPATITQNCGKNLNKIQDAPWSCWDLFSSWKPCLEVHPSWQQHYINQNDEMKQNQARKRFGGWCEMLHRSPMNSKDQLAMRISKSKPATTSDSNRSMREMSYSKRLETHRGTMREVKVLEATAKNIVTIECCCTVKWWGGVCQGQVVCSIV